MSNQASLYIDPVSGNVGIGTTVPLATLDIIGNAYFSGGVSAGNLGMFRNRIINGDMRIDQRNTGTGVGGLTGSYLTYKTQPANFYTVDRFAVAAPVVGAVVAKQVTLNTSDRVALDGQFDKAVELGLVPKEDLAVYLPFDSNITDASGNGVTMTPVGTMQYVDACVIGSNALYLANEANVTEGTISANRLSTAYTYPTNWTVSFWACATSLNGSYNRHLFSSGSSSITSSVVIYLTTSNQCVAAVWGTGNIGSVFSLGAEKVWFHVALSCTNRAFAFYVNGVQSGSSSTYSYIADIISLTTPTVTQSAFAGFIDDFRFYNRALSASEVAALATNVGLPVAPSTTGLTTRLTFDNTTTDAQGTLPAPTVTGTASYSPICKVGTASLDLTGNNVTGTPAANALTYTLTSGSFSLPITASGWFNAAGLGGAQTIMTIGNNSAGTVYSIEIFCRSSNKIAFGVYVGSWISVETTFTINAGMWYHVALTATASSYLNAYVNGILVATIAVPAGTLGLSAGSGTPTQLRIGAETGTSIATALKGLIDDVRIYNRVLTSREVAGLYASSQYAAQCLFQQTIEGNNLSDLMWGTVIARPLTTSLWIKNKSSSSQQFSISATNTKMLAWIDFENGSYADKLGFLINAKLTGSGAITTSTYKIGTASFDFTANVQSSTPNTRLDYGLATYLAPPLTKCLWFYIPTGATLTGTQSFLSDCYTYLTGTTVAGGLSFSITSSSIYVDCWVGPAVTPNNGGLGANYITATYSVSLALNTWYHMAVTMSIGDRSRLYLNGVQVATSTNYCPTGYIVCNSGGQNGYPVNGIRFGAYQGATGLYGFKGYIDDVRIYNQALSAEQIFQIYANNANSTTSSSYLIPRSLVYNTPVLPANTWQKVSLTIPGDTTGQWMTNTDAGLTLSLCLGATGLYNTTTLGTWLDAPEYMGSNVQLIGNSDDAFLANLTNSIYVTGWQLEKGTMVTPFEFRPTGIELQLCQRYLEVLTYITNNSYTADGYSRAFWFYKTTKRNIPILLQSASSSFGYKEIGLDHLIVYTQNASSSLTSGSIVNAEI